MSAKCTSGTKKMPLWTNNSLYLENSRPLQHTTLMRLSCIVFEIHLGTLWVGHIKSALEWQTIPWWA